MMDDQFNIDSMEGSTVDPMTAMGVYLSPSAVSLKL
jgi:hypothetical protein